MTKEELILWRKGRGLTQVGLAELAGVSRITVVRWEKGEHSVPVDVLAKLEAQSPSIKASQPAVLSTIRVRPYPWGQRDYTATEVDRLPVGSQVWRAAPNEPKAEWRIKIMLSTRGHGKGLHMDRCDVALPLEAFPDPLGLEASWARDMFNARMSSYTATFTGLRQAMKDAGIPEE